MNQAAYDELCCYTLAHGDPRPVPESHLQLVEERLRRHRENPSAARPAFEVIDRLSKKTK